MRKQKYNIFILLIVLAIPFALSSQTRKAIPGGRFEALSGIKNARSHASALPSASEKKDSTTLFWNEVLNHIPSGTHNISYFSKTEVDQFSKDLFIAKGIRKSSHLKDNATFFYSDNLSADADLLKKNKNKFHLVVLKDAKTIGEKLGALKDFDIVIYQADEKFNYYLLKFK